MKKTGYALRWRDRSDRVVYYPQKVWATKSGATRAAKRIYGRKPFTVAKVEMKK